MNDDWQSFRDARRRGEDHPLHIARYGAGMRHDADRHEGAPTGDIVCCICWGASQNGDDCHDPHLVPGLPEPHLGCCPAHHIRSEFYIDRRRRESRDIQPVPPRARGGAG